MANPLYIWAGVWADFLCSFYRFSLRRQNRAGPLRSRLHHCVLPNTTSFYVDISLAHNQSRFSLPQRYGYFLYPSSFFINKESLLVRAAKLYTSVMTTVGPERDIRWGIEQRLEFIEFRLFWDGEINRSGITKQFSISVPQASNDLKRYAEQAPGNLVYDKSLKRYVQTRTNTSIVCAASLTTW
jgi:hypothetical protein